MRVWSMAWRKLRLINQRKATFCLINATVFRDEALGYEGRRND
jgi:hypothetical protein